MSSFASTLLAAVAVIALSGAPAACQAGPLPSGILPPPFQNVTIVTHRVADLVARGRILFVSKTTSTFMDVLDRFQPSGPPYPPHFWKGEAEAFVLVGTPAAVPAINATIPVLADPIFGFDLSAPYRLLHPGDWAPAGGTSPPFLSGVEFVPPIPSLAGVTFSASVVIGAALRIPGTSQWVVLDHSPAYTFAL